LDYVGSIPTSRAFIMNNTKNNNVGVIVGRFQVPSFHDAHKTLFYKVAEHFDEIIVFVGVSPTKNTTTDPLDYTTRSRMISEWVNSNLKIKLCTFVPIFDHESDEIWSNNLDHAISNLIGANRTAVLCGSRDSFIGSYSGKYKTQTIDINSPVSGTEIRSKCVIDGYTEDFRYGVINATQQRFPVAYQVVDFAVWQKGKVLLIQKEGDGDQWRFPGGFSDPTSPSLEDDVKREIAEELGLIEYERPVKYIGSCLIDDWRYRRGPDKIKSAFFGVQYLWGPARAGDDAKTVKWINISDLMNVIKPQHRELAEKFIVWYNDQGK
jgi:bifunctional NMN adenylyltransferase/nudix hydrolase